ncbi:hypothetical protein K3495_g16456, partial [Podosphaera aphanis]
MKDARDLSKSVSIDDIKYIELHLTKHFPEANEVKKVVPDELVENLAQGRDEKLEAYSLRTFDILLAFEVTDGTKKSAAENYILKKIINAYGKGLYDKNLRDEVCSSRDWFMCDTLSAASQVVHATSKFLEAKAEAEKETIKFRKLEILERMEQGILPQREYDAYRVSLGKPKQPIPRPQNAVNYRAVPPVPPAPPALVDHKVPSQDSLALVPFGNRDTVPELTPKEKQLPDPRTSRHPFINGQRAYNGETCCYKCGQFEGVGVHLGKDCRNQP